ncbi:S-type anion channel SLAH1-like [Vigna unguiculata]|uniref:Tellurite resistance/dicarboxylate transporter n=1 Tax=Vigna unguiculata TaxID=3917 RepID=A0A4D6LH92_VIGUN|nr:S-type anion channel SLAH1-like [Vigna unguiculata]QCD87957.1 tellurite resistance/dicarboxylate transporter [Vigna unguiculata]
MDENEKQHPQPHVELPIDVSVTETESNCTKIQSLCSILTQFHAGYFRISLSLTSQAFLLKILIEPIQDAHALRRLFSSIPSSVHTLLWFLAFFVLGTLSFLYILKCVLHFDRVKDEFLNHVGVNYLFVPWICWLILLESSPFLSPRTLFFKILWWVFVVPMVMLDVKIYGQWFTKGKRFLSVGANPTSQLSVIGNLVGAQAAAQMGWKESALCMFSLGIVHYLVLFVTLYQRLAGNNSIPSMLRPVFFLFFAAPSMASLAWNSICGQFDTTCKMLFFLSFFLFLSLVSRPMLFKKSMKKFNVAWWAYSFPLTALALASVEYAHEVKGIMAHTIMFLLSAVSVFVSLLLLLITAIKISRHAFTSLQP